MLHTRHAGTQYRTMFLLIVFCVHCVRDGSDVGIDMLTLLFGRITLFAQSHLPILNALAHQCMHHFHCFAQPRVLFNSLHQCIVLLKPRAPSPFTNALFCSAPPSPFTNALFCTAPPSPFTNALFCTAPPSPFTNALFSHHLPSSMN